MIDICRQCNADRGPWEVRPCPVMLKAAGHRVKVPDLGVHVLENSERPLTVYDIARSIRRDLSVMVNQSTLRVAISQDPRYCWAGKGLYGLYRHGLLPGPRSLGGVAQTFLYSHGQPLMPSQLEFAMKQAGYRFQTASLYQAIIDSSDAFWVEVEGVWCYDTKRTEAAQRRLRQSGTYPLSPADFETITRRCAESIRESLTEHQRRLGRPKQKG